ncbi:hypothetical protein A33Q_0596 [Indibacter alkaliphilus LW1]|uniref:Serine aminopeptidase S33 domain-containing protein n=1 Tax=Indibacter alkaliphilus (strain CCUG 57479 / KCTC 22604 / LW1) TaxID=1189612 RepID=S2EA53_INDAL|nr:alpha/beta hydrolase [Indibacter alkaliphilus]EOZ99218.1 hypothetical protein A33Q_0596 [Indibacter alkaliphilus LW1]
MKKILTIIIFLLIAPLGFSQEIEGIWNSTLEVQPGRKLLFVFQITKIANKLESEIDIPSQGVKGIRTSKTIFEDGQLFIDASNIGFKYSGTWNTATGNIEGTFQEGVNKVPLGLTKEVLEEIKLNRPQEPTLPYPYLEEEVKFENLEAKITLAGTLTLPNLSGKKPPVVILISGSGPQDRNQSFQSHRTFLVLADHLTKMGISVLRFDDRGFGESTGNFAESNTADFATDVLSAIDFLKRRSDIDVNKLGLVGHSEGAIIAPMVANQSKDVNFIVMLGGTGTAGKEVSLRQAIDSRNFPIADEKQYKTYVKEAIDIASSERETDIVRRELKTYYQNSDLLASLLPPNVDREEFIETLVAARTTPWVRYFYNYNPVTEIKKIKVPALALYGSNDTQVPPKYHLQPVKESLALSESKNYEVVLIEGLNHLFQESKSGLISEYSQIEQTFAPVALEKISSWILKQTK